MNHDFRHGTYALCGVREDEVTGEGQCRPCLSAGFALDTRRATKEIAL